METRRLQSFLHIADAGSISKAAVAAGLAQPALSRQLAILESELKTQLVERSASGIRLTAAGHALYARAQIIVRQVSSLRQDMAGDPNGLSGLVAIGLAPSHELYLGLPLVARARELYPNLRLQIVTSGALYAQLQVGSIDLAVAPGDTFDPNIEAEPLLREEMLLVRGVNAPPPPRDLAGLAALPWIVTRLQNAVHGILGSVFAGTELTPNVVAEINTLPLVLHAVSLGMGVSLLARPSVADAIARGMVAATPIGDPPLVRTISLCMRRKPAPTPGIAAVAQLFRDIVAEKLNGDTSAPLIYPARLCPPHKRSHSNHA